MAAAACFGGPVFQLLMGTGVRSAADRRRRRSLSAAPERRTFQRRASSVRAQPLTPNLNRRVLRAFAQPALRQPGAGGCARAHGEQPPRPLRLRDAAAGLLPHRRAPAWHLCDPLCDERKLVLRRFIHHPLVLPLPAPQACRCTTSSSSPGGSPTGWGQCTPSSSSYTPRSPSSERGTHPRHPPRPLTTVIARSSRGGGRSRRADGGVSARRRRK